MKNGKGLEFAGEYSTNDPITEAFKVAKSKGIHNELYWPDAKVMKHTTNEFTVYIPYIKRTEQD